jgi:hypothetical protein
MANYADSLWGTAQHILNEQMTRPEFKRKPSAALTAFLRNTQFAVPANYFDGNGMAIKQSDSQTVEVALLTKQSTGGAAGNRAAAHTGNINDSKKATATFTTYVAPFKYSLKQADRNFFGLAEMVAAQIRSAAIDIHGAIETALIAVLSAGKSQVVASATPYGGTWDAANHIFGVANADEKLVFERIRGFMRQQYYNGNMYFVHSEAMQQLANYLIQQGQGNSENLFWQMDGLLGFNSQEIATAGYTGSGYMFEEGTVGILPWIPKMNLDGHSDEVGTYFSIPDPLGSGLTFAVHQYKARSDNHAAAGERQDVNVEVEISVDLAPVIAPMSTANDSPVYKVGLLSA